jgi:nicotinate-nucleotide pyrophosphorylase (carboxylating)
MSFQSDIVKAALREDAGKRDITSALVVPKGKKARAAIITRENCVVCGLDVAREVFKTRDKKIKFTALAADGKVLKKGRILAKIEGEANSILAAERVALNFLALLSGVATITQAFVKAVRPYKVKILDTRKTIPGLRQLQKYAVRKGGGYNHRLSLSDMILIKDNHLKITRSSGQGVRRIRKIIKEVKEKSKNKLMIEIEVKNLSEFKEALKAAPDIIMLDNMDISGMKKALKFMRGASDTPGPGPQRRTLLEASGGITLKNVKQVASTGIDMISVGGLTHSVKSIDVSLEIL